MKDFDKNPIMEMAEQGMKNCENLFRTGLKFQEEASQYWNAWSSPGTMAKAQKRYSMAAMVEDVVPIAQKRMEEMVDLIGKNAQTGAELMRKAVEAVDVNATPERDAKWADFWKSSFRAVRSNADEWMHINVRSLDNWLDLIQENIEIAEIKPETSSRSSKS